jgi:hypothetical protein
VAKGLKRLKIMRDLVFIVYIHGLRPLNLSLHLLSLSIVIRTLFTPTARRIHYTAAVMNMASTATLSHKNNHVETRQCNSTAMAAGDLDYIDNLRV